MNKYQMSVHRYDDKKETFVVEAEDKKEALEKGKKFVLQNPKYTWHEYDLNDVKCDKKLKK